MAVDPWRSWPPGRDEFFLPASLHRPLFQGDVFRDVPIVKARAGDRRDSDPEVTIERRYVALLDYACDIYSPAGDLGKVQQVAVVREGDKLRVPPTWEGAFTACPLPNLLGDGALWAADFLALSPVDRSYLAPTNRVASLSELGWAYFRQRLALCFTRALIILQPLEAVGQTTWNEVQLWEEWNRRDLVWEGFQPWLDAFDPNLGFRRRAALQRGMGQVLLSLLPAARPG